MNDKSFFKGVPQQTIDADGLSGKLPCFYYDNMALSVVYTAPLERLRALLPDSRYEPLRLTGRSGLLAITAFNYRDTDIAPYNELSIAVLLEKPGLGGFPPLGLLRQNWQQAFHAFVVELPVTTEIARRGGVELYNYPKFLADIDFTDHGDRVSCRLGEKGREILTLTVPKLPTRKRKVARYYTYPVRNGEILRAEVRMNPLEVGMAFRPRNVELSIGRGHRICERLAGIELGSRPLQVQYLASMQAILFGAEPIEARTITGEKRAAVA